MTNVITNKVLTDKLTAKLNGIIKDVNNEEYDGMSNFYYYCHEDMPQRIANLKWVASDLLKDALTPEWIEAFLQDLNKIKY